MCILSDGKLFEESKHVFRAFQVVLVIKNTPANARDVREPDLIPGSGISIGGGHGNPLQYSCLKNPMDHDAWQAMVHRVARVGQDD